MDKSAALIEYCRTRLRLTGWLKRKKKVIVGAAAATLLVLVATTVPLLAATNEKASNSEVDSNPELQQHIAEATKAHIAKDFIKSGQQYEQAAAVAIRSHKNPVQVGEYYALAAHEIGDNGFTENAAGKS